MSNTNWGKMKHKSYIDESNIVITKHWGECLDNKTLFIPDVSADIEKSMNKFTLDDFKPDSNEHSEHLTLSPIDPLISHAIELHKHANKMNEIIRLAELAIEANLIPSEDAALPLPEKPLIIKRHVKNNLNFIPKDFTTFTEGEETAYPEISAAMSKEILTKSVATMFAHIGYETTHESVLLLLTDVLEDFLLKIGLKFKTSSEEEDKDGSIGYACFPEKVLIELGFGGVKGIHDYYENRVVKYVNKLEKRSKELNKKYETLLIPKCYLPDDSHNKLLRVKKEEEEDLVENEMHFPSIEGEVGFSSLEPGFQLLNSLEAHLGETEEEITASPGASPGASVTPGSATDLAINCAKKKRTK